MAQETSQSILKLLDEHLSSDRKLHDFSIPDQEVSEWSQDQLNIIALITVVKDISSEFPNHNNRGSARFHTVKNTFKTINFDIIHTSSAAIYLIDLASQGVIDINFDIDAFEINEDQEKRYPVWEMEVNFAAIENTEPAAEVPPIATIHLPSNFYEAIQKTDSDYKATMYSSVFAAGYALDLADRILKDEAKLRGFPSFTEEPFQLEAGFLQLPQLHQKHEKEAKSIVATIARISSVYQSKFADFYSHMLKLPDVREIK